VPPEGRGQGIAGKLLDALITDAREQGFKIVPQCSYVAAAFRRHPEWADLLAETPG
jgi:predicted GNAT family acetyltransferase